MPVHCGYTVDILILSLRAKRTHSAPCCTEKLLCHPEPIKDLLNKLLCPHPNSLQPSQELMFLLLCEDRSQAENLSAIDCFHCLLLSFQLCPCGWWPTHMISFLCLQGCYPLFCQPRFMSDGTCNKSYWFSYSSSRNLALPLLMMAKSASIIAKSVFAVGNAHTGLPPSGSSIFAFDTKLARSSGVWAAWALFRYPSALSTG